MKVLVIPEDPRNDQHILKPLLERLFESIGKASVRVRICQAPVLGGIGEALKSKRLAEIVERYQGMIDLFILCVDRDGIPGRRLGWNEIESEFGTALPSSPRTPGRRSKPGLLAGLTLPRNWNWADVRAEVRVKERYFNVLARNRGVADGPGGGRQALGKEAARNIPAIRQKCPEDFDALARRIEAAAGDA